jgi:hypothetical protein
MLSFRDATAEKIMKLADTVKRLKGSVKFDPNPGKGK